MPKPNEELSEISRCRFHNGDSRDPSRTELSNPATFLSGDIRRHPSPLLWVIASRALRVRMPDGSGWTRSVARSANEDSARVVVNKQGMNQRNAGMRGPKFSQNKLLVEFSRI